MDNNKQYKRTIRDTLVKQACNESKQATACCCSNTEILCMPCAEIRFNLMLKKARNRDVVDLEENLSGMDMAVYAELRANKDDEKLDKLRRNLDERIDDQVQRITYRDPASRGGRSGITTRRGSWATRLARRTSRSLDTVWKVEEYYDD